MALSLRLYVNVLSLPLFFSLCLKVHFQYFCLTKSVLYNVFIIELVQRQSLSIESDRCTFSVCLMWLSGITRICTNLPVTKTSSGSVVGDCCGLQMCVSVCVSAADRVQGPSCFEILCNYSFVSEARCPKSLSPLSLNSAGPSWDSEQENTALNECASMCVLTYSMVVTGVVESKASFQAVRKPSHVIHSAECMQIYAVHHFVFSVHYSQISSVTDAYTSSNTTFTTFFTFHGATSK